MFYTTIHMEDGFGAQYQKIIQTYIYCKLYNLNFLYTPFVKVAHNYDDNQNFINKLEDMINLKNNIENSNDTQINRIDFGSIVMKYCEKNIDKICNSDHMKFIKQCFWQNKERDVFKNKKINIAIHIRRENNHDKGQAGLRIITPNDYYLNIMNIIRKKYINRDLQFHIYSQGNINNFNILNNEDVIFHLNEDICKTFIELVAADILVTSPSSLSYVAALLSDSFEIYYKKFWHNPRKEWIVLN
jgi:hypothetical protein